MSRSQMTPLEPYPGLVMTPWLMQCEICGHMARVSLNQLRRGESGCLPCSRRINGAAQRIAPDEAEANMRAAGLEPLAVYPGLASDPWLCRCINCGKAVRPSLACIRRGQGGCRSCGHTFWKSESVTLYLLTHEAWDAVKIGVSSKPETRLRELGSLGWQVHHLFDGLPPEVAHTVEQHILGDWTARGVRGAVAKAQMPFGGYTETAPREAVDLDSVQGAIESYLVSQGSTHVQALVDVA